MILGQILKSQDLLRIIETIYGVKISGKICDTDYFYYFKFMLL